MSNIQKIHKGIGMQLVKFGSLSETVLQGIFSSNQIPSILVTEKYHNNNQFEIIDSSNNSSLSYKSSDIYVSSISCIVPIGALLVGYNNGSFQLYSLSNSALIYSFKNTTSNVIFIFNFLTF
jgi:PPE-repeat protein